MLGIPLNPVEEAIPDAIRSKVDNPTIIIVITAHVTIAPCVCLLMISSIMRVNIYAAIINPIAGII